jgi:hypothetical protein
MKIPRVRFTMRRLMVAVAILGFALGVAELWRRSRLYTERASDHAGRRSNILQSPGSIAYWESRWQAQREGRSGAYPWPDGPPFVPAIADYHDQMWAKWERAARLPWLPVEPDPAGSY